MILDTIVAAKKQELAILKHNKPEKSLDQYIEQHTLIYKENIFKKCIRREEGAPVKIIAEIKKASPSKGIIRPDFDYKEIAQTYIENQVDAISVLTDEQFFQGSLGYIRDLSQTIDTPILRKDFTIDKYHIKEALVAGAKAVLLIASILTEKQLNDFIRLCDSYNMGYIVEIHDKKDLQKVLMLDHVDIIGINNRDLHTFTVDLHTSERLLQSIPKSVVTVSESGIHTAADAAYLSALNVDAVLIGEGLMKEKDITRKFNEIFGALRNGTR